MLTFPLPNGASLTIIEPGNIRRMKEGKPLRIAGEHMVCFTPDMQGFLNSLGVDLEATVGKGERIEKFVNLKPEQIDESLRACRNLPEVER